MKIKGVYPWGKEWPPPKGAGNYDPSLKLDDFQCIHPVLEVLSPINHAL